MAKPLIRIQTVLGDLASMRYPRDANGKFLTTDTFFRVSFTGVTCVPACSFCAASGYINVTTCLAGTYDLPFFGCTTGTGRSTTFKAATTAGYSIYASSPCVTPALVVTNVDAALDIGTLNSANTGQIRVANFFAAFFDLCALLSAGSLVVNNIATVACTGPAVAYGGSATITVMCP